MHVCVYIPGRQLVGNISGLTPNHPDLNQQHNAQQITQKVRSLDSQSLPQEVTEMHADLCSALADPSRILLLYALAEKPRNVSELAELIGISQPGASRHLKLLRERGLVRAVRVGPAIEYSLQDLRLIEALDTLRSVLRDRIAYRASLIDLDSE